MNQNFFDILLRALKAQGENIRQQVVRVTKVTSKLTSKIITFFRNIINSFLHKPESLEDYVRVGSYYLSKRAAFVIAAGLISVCVLFINVVYPALDGWLWTGQMTLNSTKFHNFTGRAQVKDVEGVVIYRGRMQDGSLEGEGQQYDPEGTLIYTGSFVNNQYQGNGRLFEDRILRYDGMFDKGVFSGDGRLYNASGRLIYSGSFVNGMQEGTGTEYHPRTGRKSYYGDMSGGVRQGNGNAYAADGESILYTGAFAAGVYSGEGTLYEENKVLYEGNFENGLFSGEGILYDITTGRKQYQGSFQAGVYEGEGKLYDVETGQVRYEGAFSNGLFEGDGIQYDSLGAVLYSGKFRGGMMDFMGYLGQDIDSLRTAFGNESRRQQTEDGKLVLTYLAKNMAMILTAQGDSYVCTNILCDVSNGFGGIEENSTPDQVHQLFGEPYSYYETFFSQAYMQAFTSFGIALSAQEAIYSEKFTRDDYFIRVFYNAQKNRALAIEIKGYLADDAEERS